MYHSSDEREDDWDEDEDDDDGYVPCPHCGETMLEAADHCPACDRWITSEESPPTRHSLWIIIVVLLVIAAFIVSALRI